MLSLVIKLTELGLIPEPVLRIGIKKLIGQRLSEIPVDPVVRESQKANFIEKVALETPDKIITNKIELSESGPSKVEIEKIIEVFNSNGSNF